MKKTKIICTIGPATSSNRIIRKMYQAGMNGARINAAYGTIDQYETTIERVRSIADIPLILDLKGPEIRIRARKSKLLKKGDVLELGSGLDAGFNVDIYDRLNVGDRMFIDNGKLRTRIVEKRSNCLKLISESDGKIDDGRGVNIPHKKFSIPTLSDKERKILDFAVKKEVEFIALSFARNASDVRNLRKAAGGSFQGGIIAKIENSEGVDDFADILDVSDGVMVARGDLGVEIQPEKVPHIQKSIIRACNQKGKLVITATDMLESMINEPIPTRAEVSDVANAILDGTDATMLSGETAVGKYPVESVSMMSKIAEEAEKTVMSSVKSEGFTNASETISEAVRRICEEMPVDKVVTLTRSGYTARMISRFRIRQLIIAVTTSKNVAKQLQLSYGVCPSVVDYLKEREPIRSSAENLCSEGLVRGRDLVLFTAATITAEPHSTNLIEIHQIGELTRRK